MDLPWLSNEPSAFPHPSEADNYGLLAVGGDLSVERLQTAYRNGIFPWFGNDEPILWWSPNPRCVLFPDKLHLSHSMKPVIKNKNLEVHFDRDFPAVIRHCSSIPRKQEGNDTWITQEMIEAYIALHHAGQAHSVEIYRDNKLVGGLYGVLVGSCFCGESMFTRAPNCSKLALYHLVQRLAKKGGWIIDCQAPNDHLTRLGAECIPRDDFLKQLTQCREEAPAW